MLIEREGRWFVQGPMTMDQAAGLLEQGALLCDGGDRIFDLAEVTVADSSAIAVVLGWLRRARAGGKTAQVWNPPAAFVSLADLYGVDELLKAFIVPAASKDEHVAH